MTDSPNPQSEKSSSRSSKDRFPRTADLPLQSPKYWAKEKDRYLRQLLISDIQEQTGRELIVYFTFDGMIDNYDADDISEVLNGCKSSNIDLLIQTPGGFVDACEKIISILKLRAGEFRVIVPGAAKSAGTVIALSANEIIMGVNSELGPIDPQFNGIPAQNYLDDPKIDDYIKVTLKNAIQRNAQLAFRVLLDGQMKGKAEQSVHDLVTHLSLTDTYLSHGAVINAVEARDLGLNVQFLRPDDELWQRIWLLHCMYEYDSIQRGYAKIFEGQKNSISRSIPPQNSQQ